MSHNIPCMYIHVGVGDIHVGAWYNHSRNIEPKHGLKPLMIGLLVVAIEATYGYNCGYAINPAKDFSPR